MVEPKCTRHPGVRAAWRCRGCGAALCPGCAWVQRAGTVEFTSCTRCRGAADPITVHRRELRSFAARLPGAFVYPLLPGPLVAIVAAGAVLALFSYGGVGGAAIAFGIRWTFLFSVVLQGAKGARGYEPAEIAEDGLELLGPSLRGLVGTAIVWVPAGARFFLTLAATRDPIAAIADPVLWLILAAGVVYAPAALMHAAAGGRALEMLNPLYVGSFVVRLGADYALAVVAIVVLGAAGAGLSVAGALAAALPVPIVSRVLAESIGLLAQTGMARVLGLLLHVRGDALAYGPESDYEVPVFPGAVPRGAEPVLATAVADPAPEAIAVDTGAPASGPHARFAAIAAPPPADPAPAPPDPAAAIAAAVAAGDAAGAADRFEAYRGPPAAIPARALFAVAKAAAEAGRHPLAARALHAAGTGEDAAVAPNALLALARVYERRLGRAADARQVLEYLVARWPASEAAGRARAQLSPPAAG